MLRRFVIRCCYKGGDFKTVTVSPRNLLEALERLRDTQVGDMVLTGPCAFICHVVINEQRLTWSGWRWYRSAVITAVRGDNGMQWVSLS